MALTVAFQVLRGCGLSASVIPALLKAIKTTSHKACHHTLKAYFVWCNSWKYPNLPLWLEQHVHPEESSLGIGHSLSENTGYLFLVKAFVQVMAHIALAVHAPVLLWDIWSCGLHRSRLLRLFRILIWLMLR